MGNHGQAGQKGKLVARGKGGKALKLAWDGQRDRHYERERVPIVGRRFPQKSGKTMRKEEHYEIAPQGSQRRKMGNEEVGVGKM